LLAFHVGCDRHLGINICGALLLTFRQLSTHLSRTLAKEFRYNGTPLKVSALKCAAKQEGAISTKHFLKDYCQQIESANAVFAIAGPVNGQCCELTNYPWITNARELRETFKFEARIVNDFEAVAFSLPSLTAADVVGIGGGNSTHERRWCCWDPGPHWVSPACCQGSQSRSSFQARAGMRLHQPARSCAQYPSGQKAGAAH
jgi:Glucokinase